MNNNQAQVTGPGRIEPSVQQVNDANIDPEANNVKRCPIIDAGGQGRRCRIKTMCLSGFTDQITEGDQIYIERLFPSRASFVASMGCADALGQKYWLIRTL